MRKNYLVFGSPLIEEAEINEVVDTLRTGWIGSGPKVQQFEEAFREYVGSKYSVAVSSCTAGLHLAVIALGLGEGDEVILPTMTFAATANAVIHSNAKPVLVDVDPVTMDIDCDDILRKITPRTKAIIPVHFAGRPCNIDRILEIANAHNLRLIHDNAHAIEAVYHGKKTGAFPDISSYSFYVTKNVVTGEGGMITTDDDELAEKIKIYALHGMSKDAWKRFSDDGFKHYQIFYPGYKYNMTDIQASLGIHQLRRVESSWQRRRAIFERYRTELQGLPLILPADAEPDTRHAHHLFSPLVDIGAASVSRDQLIQLLHERNIGTGVHYIALHLHPFYRDEYKYRCGDFPNAEFISERTISLPFSAKLTDDDVQDVITALKEILV